MSDATPEASPVLIPHRYRCGIRSTTPDGRISLRLVHDDADQAVGPLHPPELDLVLPDAATAGVAPGDLVTLHLAKA